MSKITIIEDTISKKLKLKLCVTEEKYTIRLIDLNYDHFVSLEELDKKTFKIESALERYSEIRDNIVKEKYKNVQESILKKDKISNRKTLYLKNGVLYYEIGYKVVNDVSMGMSVVKEQVLERESKFDVDLDTILNRYNELRVKLHAC